MKTKRSLTAFAAVALAVPLFGAGPLGGGEIGPLQKVLLRPLVLYPEETRKAILEVARHPDLVAQIKAHPEKYKGGKPIEGYGPETAVAAAEVAPFPDVLAILDEFPKYTKLIGFLYDRKPKEVLDFVSSLSEEEAAKVETAEENGEGEPAATEPAPAPTEPAPATTAPATIAYIYEDEDCAEELAALAAAFPQYANLALANAEAVNYILNNYASYINTATELLQAYEALGAQASQAVSTWVAAAEKALGWTYQAGQAASFLEGVQAARKLPDFKGKFWENDKLRSSVLDGVKDFPHLAGRVLEEHGKGAKLPGVEDWVRKIGEEHGLALDGKRPNLFTESASLLEKNPALKGKLFDNPDGIQAILKRGRGNPEALGEVFKRKEGAAGGALTDFAKKKPNAAKNLDRAIGRGPGGAARPGGASGLNKGQRIGNATNQHKKSWGAQARSGGGAAGGRGKTGRGSAVSSDPSAAMKKSPRRCWPSGDDALMDGYHDKEWGVPAHDDRRHFEYLVLDAFQAGLSWRTVLHKRENFRRAFDGFDPRRVAGYRGAKLKRLLKDAGIIRNRQKIAGTVRNARAFLKIQEEFGSFDRYVWRFTRGRPIRPCRRRLADLPARSRESDAMSLDLKARGFTFVGSTICYAYMQAAGLVNDHLVGCPRRARCR